MDREKVIKDLEECMTASCRGYRPRLSCPYNDEEWDIMRDALALLKEQEDLGTELTNAVELIHKKNERIKKLLKEQEPKPVKVVKNAYNEDFYFCPNCDRQFYGLYKRPLYCDRCGQAVKWE